MAMMGTVVMEDLTITYVVKLVETIEGIEQYVTYTICDGLTGQQETRVVDAPSFMAALAIAVHWEGVPNVEHDYPYAEEVQPVNPDLRFIP